MIASPHRRLTDPMEFVKKRPLYRPTKALLAALG